MGILFRVLMFILTRKIFKSSVRISCITVDVPSPGPVRSIMVSKPVKVIPSLGDEVLFNAGEKWCPAEVIAIHPSGDLSLMYVLGVESVRQRSRHGSHMYGWLTYAEAVEEFKTKVSV